jgi:hypothetical protein
MNTKSFIQLKAGKWSAAALEASKALPEKAVSAENLDAIEVLLAKLLATYKDH